jgi:hypothetical protein
MAKKPTSKDTGIRAKENKPGAGELRDDDLQEVTGGILVNHPTGPVTTGPIEPTDPTGPTGPTGPICVSAIT